MMNVSISIHLSYPCLKWLESLKDEAWGRPSVIGPSREVVGQCSILLCMYPRVDGCIILQYDAVVEVLSRSTYCFASVK